MAFEELSGYYDSIADLVPPDIQVKIQQQKHCIEQHIDNELAHFGQELIQYINAQLEKKQEQLQHDLQTDRAALHVAIEKCIASSDLGAEAVSTAAHAMQHAQQAYEQRWLNYGKTLRGVLLAGLEDAGIPQAGLVGNMLFEDKKDPTTHTTLTNLPVSPFDLLDDTPMSLQHAAGLAEFARLAYRDEQDVDARIQQWGGQLTTWIDDTEIDTQAFIATNAEHIILSFRGTEKNVKDITTDLEFKKSCPSWATNITIHHGFNKAFSPAVQKAIQQTLSTLSGKRLWVCGHSLGGALASVAGAWLTTQQHHVHGILTIGQPRTGDIDFKNWYDNTLGLQSKHLRFTNDHDMVPHVPPRFVHYHHVGTHLHFDEHGTLQHNPPQWLQWVDTAVDTMMENDNWKERLSTVAERFKGDHNTDLYVERIRTAYHTSTHP